MTNKHSLVDPVMAAPPVSTGILTIFGVPLSDWALLLSILCSIFLLIDKLPAVVTRLRAFYNLLKNYGKGK